MNCKLPWTSSRSKELQNCTTSDHLTNFTALSQSMTYFGESNYYQMTKCLQPCQYYHFKAKQVRIHIQSYIDYISVVLSFSVLDGAY